MILTGIPCASPELAGGVGSRVPDYRERFLRGLQSGHSVGQTVANSIKSHNHTQPTHTHSFSGQLVSTALSGTAAGQSVSSAANLGVSGWAAGQSITSGGAGGQTYQALGQLQGDGIRTIWGTFVGGDWSGHDNQGGSSGAFWPAGNAGVQEGDDYNQIRYSFDVSRVTPVVGEVRPVNRAVRYLIRAR